MNLSIIAMFLVSAMMLVPQTASTSSQTDLEKAYSLYAAGLSHQETAAPAEDPLASLFTNGNIRMAAKPMAGFVLSVEDLELPEEYAEAAATEPEEAEAWLNTLYPVSISPDGKSAILTDGQLAVAYYGGKVRLILPNFEKSVPDEYGNFQKVWSRPFRNLFDNALDDIVWSPDGRYAAITNYRQILQMTRMETDPWIIDLQTGDVIMLAAYGNNFIKGTAGAPLTACFSRDGRYVYYMIYGTIAAHHTTLVRYDLQQKQMTVCCSVSDLDYYPRLWELQDGSLMMLQDVSPRSNSSQYQGIARYVQSGSGWMRFAHSAQLKRNYAYTSRLRYSAASGCALTLTTLLQFGNGAFQCFRPDGGYAGMEDYYVFDPAVGGIKRLSAAEMHSTLEGLSESMGGAEKPELPFESILSAALSPDGHYALFFTSSPEEKHIRLVWLDEMLTAEVEVSDIESLLALPSDRNSMVWSADAILMTTKNGIGCFVLE